MTRTLLPLALGVALIAPTTLRAQNTMGDALSGRCSITWAGVDYSAIKMTPKYEFGDVERAGPEFYARWNNLFESEPTKYNFCEAMKAKDCATATAIVEQVNAQAKVADAFTKGGFDPSEIPNMVRRYNQKSGGGGALPGMSAASSAGADREGVGCVLIAEIYDKTPNAERAVYHVTFFDLKTSEVLHVEKVTTKPGGFGVRNYWAATVYDVMKQIKGNYLKAWQKRFLK